MGCMLPAFLMWITYGREVLSLILASAARDIDGREEIKSPGHYALEQEDLRQWINTASLQLSRRLTDALFPSSILKAALLCDDERINIKLSARSDSKLLQKILTNSQGRIHVCDLEAVTLRMSVQTATYSDDLGFPNFVYILDVLPSNSWFSLRM